MEGAETLYGCRTVFTVSQQVQKLLFLLCGEFSPYLFLLSLIHILWEECDVVELCQTALSTVEYGRKTSALFLFETPVPSLVVTTDAQRLKQVLIDVYKRQGQSVRPVRPH